MKNIDEYLNETFTNTDWEQLKNYINANYVERGKKQMTDEDFKEFFYKKTRSNVHYEDGERILELSLEGLQDFFEVIDVILSK